MEFRISDTFQDSLTRLSAQDQKAVKTTAFDLQLNLAKPGLQFHKIERAKDNNFWSVRVNRDIRIIVHKTDSSLLLCYVDHHDDAYHWAERRRIERHPRTGAAQLVEVVERTVEVERPLQRAELPVNTDPQRLHDSSDEQLLDYGVPENWLNTVRSADDDTFLEMLTRLPQEAAEALLNLATGVIPQPAFVAVEAADPFDHPDAQRRFRTLNNIEELRLALDYPWEKWTVFLHPSQRDLVERQYNGPVRISGSAGTGKTVVGLHRAVHLARRDADKRILLATFSRTLAEALQRKLPYLIGNDEAIRQRIVITDLEDQATRLYQGIVGQPLQLASAVQIENFISEASEDFGDPRFPYRFLLSEWRFVVDAWQLRQWDDYRDVSRLGRRMRISGQQRERLWNIFATVQQKLAQHNLKTTAEVFAILANRFSTGSDKPFDHIVVDEAQDLGVPELRFLASIAKTTPDSLFFCGDLGQRIFQQPFSWKALGIDIRGRSYTLKVNYRTSHQIRSTADRLLPQKLQDADGVEESRHGTISVFDGPAPLVKVFDSVDEENQFIADWLKHVVDDGIAAGEMGVCVRSAELIGRASEALALSGLDSFNREQENARADAVSIGTMHSAKGLEFKAVAVIACDDEYLPLQQRIESAGDENELEEIFETERQLLYVACTRARDKLLISGVEPYSEFIDDLLVNS